MKSLVMSVALALLLCTWAGAESSVWKIQKGTSVMYLGGTSHILRESDFPLPPEFSRAYKASKLLVFETDVAKIKDPATQQKLLTRATYADGSTIDKHLSAQAYSELSAFCQENGIPLAAVNRFRPALLISALTVMELAKAGVNQQGVDHFFYNQAIKDKKAVAGLETVDEQIEYIVTMADGHEDEFVTFSIKDMKSVTAQFAALAAAWRAGDTKKLDELMVADLKTRHPDLYRKLITDRNQNWLPMIDGFQKSSKTTFILVGVAHLVGPDGLIESLKKLGYTVDKL